MMDGFMQGLSQIAAHQDTIVYRTTASVNGPCLVLAEPGLGMLGPTRRSEAFLGWSQTPRLQSPGTVNNQRSDIL